MTNPHYTVTSIRDHSGELARMKIYNGPITVGTLPGFLSNYGDLKDALADITLGVVAKDMWVGDATDLDGSFPTSEMAQRELKVRFSYVTGTPPRRYHFEVGAPDLAALGAQAGSDFLPISGTGVTTEMQAFIDAVEAIARSPLNDVDTIEIVQAKIVGRNV